MLSVRLPEDLEAEIERLAATENRTKSDIIKDALQTYMTTRKEQKSSYELGKDLFGKHGSGESGNSQNYKTILKKKLNAKHSH